ncbi:MAG: hypothetical protein MZU97_11045 [Bacillus subtilis]|nr:hypothetical protein [Bacillus subtilis]
MEEALGIADRIAFLVENQHLPDRFRPRNFAAITDRSRSVVDYLDGGRRPSNAVSL